MSQLIGIIMICLFLFGVVTAAIQAVGVVNGIKAVLFSAAATTFIYTGILLATGKLVF